MYMKNIEVPDFKELPIIEYEIDWVFDTTNNMGKA